MASTASVSILKVIMLHSHVGHDWCIPHICVILRAIALAIVSSWSVLAAICRWVRVIKSFRRVCRRTLQLLIHILTEAGLAECKLELLL